jgi:hypothetical protein
MIFLHFLAIDHCYSGDQTVKTFDRFGKSSTCIAGDIKPCRPTDKFCLGQCSSIFVYKFNGMTHEFWYNYRHNMLVVFCIQHTASIFWRWCILKLSWEDCGLESKIMDFSYDATITVSIRPYGHIWRKTRLKNTLYFTYYLHAFVFINNIILHLI